MAAFVVFSNLDYNVTRVTSFKHVPEIFRQDEDLLVFLEPNFIVMQLVVLLILPGSQRGDLNGDFFVIYLAWIRAVVRYEFSPLDDPCTIYYEVGQAAIFNDDSIGGFVVPIKSYLIFDAFFRLIV